MITLPHKRLHHARHPVHTSRAGQLRERTIAEAAVREAFQAPEAILPQPPNRNKLIRRIVRGNKTYALVVIFEQMGNRVDIITVFKTSKLKKYL